MKLLNLLILILFLISCENKEIMKKVQEQHNSNEIKPDQVSRDFTVAFVDSSFTKAVLRGKVGRVYNDRMETLIDSGLTIDFLSKNSGKRISHLTADSARIDDRTKNMLAKGEVIVISDSSGTKLETTLLEWDNNTQKLYSTEFVTITTPEETIRGFGFESDPNLTNYKILRVSGIQK